MKQRHDSKGNGPAFTMKTYAAPGCPFPTKAGYSKRKDARRVARMHPGGGHVYRCDCGLFHVGHPAPGRTRADVRADARYYGGRSTPAA